MSTVTSADDASEFAAWFTRMKVKAKEFGERRMDIPIVHPTLRYFAWKHLASPAAQDVSRECADLAVKLANFLPDNPEKSAGLRKLLEAKDCFVRSSLDLHQGDKN